MKKYRILVSQDGYIDLFAESEEDAKENVKLMTGMDVDWDEFWTVTGIREIGNK